MESEDFEAEFRQFIQKAKHQVEVWYGCVGSERPWLEASPVDSYKNVEYRVELFVLRGSPAKGYVVADWGNRTVRAVSCFGYTRKYHQHVW